MSPGPLTVITFSFSIANARQILSPYIALPSLQYTYRHHNVESYIPTIDQKFLLLMQATKYSHLQYYCDIMCEYMRSVEIDFMASTL